MLVNITILLIRYKKIDRQVLRESCKRKATSNISTRPIKLIRNELMNSVSTELEHKDLKSVRKAMYIERRKNLPPYPTSFEDAITKINEFQDADFLMFRGKKFVHLPDDSTFICLTTEENLQCLTSCTDIFTDGTFEYAPKFFLQLYTIHGYKNGIYVPLVYFFLKNKTKNTYEAIWRFLNNLCLELCSSPLIVKKLHLDFEKGAHEAAITIFPHVTLIGCRFHYGQCLWRKVSS
uniref:MULE transposase domain-containing protein n=1 Tax=Schizaphis graminum TaxID=13262 RepID=A0A2S2NZS4_SCHGA